MNAKKQIEIPLNDLEKGLALKLVSRKDNTLFDAEDSAAENAEARYQIVEGFFYDFELKSDRYQLIDTGDNIVVPHKINPTLGTISPNIYVGTLRLPVINKDTKLEVADILLEVQSVKSNYREDYRDMLEFITEKCTDLLLQANSPVSHHFETNYDLDSSTLYQRFAFISSVIDTEEFAESVHRIVTAPVTTWKYSAETKDIRNAGKLTNLNIKQVLKERNRTRIPERHYLRSLGIESVPGRITSSRKTDSVDTPENRFVKHALETFLAFCARINDVATKIGHQKLRSESAALIDKLETILHHSIFGDISRPQTLKLNSPVLQRKEGYREVLRFWLMFDLAAKLIWKGGDDIYGAGKKDIAVLYEYWLFFKLLDLFQGVFSIDPVALSNLIQPSADGLCLQIIQGESTALKGVYHGDSRKFNVQFNYNRTFGGKKVYPKRGSWTTSLRPDYTLSVWPAGLTENDAEEKELIVHVHFDAKYKVSNLADYLSGNLDVDLNEEKTENRKGVYKNADLLKMHAYKDAIRRTGGAYILYPGDKSVKQRGFYEIIPGLGAFPVRPSKRDTGIGDLKAFILEILDHFINRTSQREKLAYRMFDIHKAPPDPLNELRDVVPEDYELGRTVIPDEVFVIIGYCKSEDHLQWIYKNQLYNFRTGTGNGSLKLNYETVSAKYLLLHSSTDKDSGVLLKIVGEGPQMYSKHDLMRKGYLSPSQENYLVVKVEAIVEPELKNIRFDFRKLKNYLPGRAAGIPFTASLAELMRVKVR